MSAEQYRAQITAIKRDPEYIKLASKHRGDLDQKNFDKYRLRIANLEAKAKACQPVEEPKRATPRAVGPIKHPVNPAKARIAAEPLPGSKKQENIIINKSKMIPKRDIHAQLVKSPEVDRFINGPLPDRDDSSLFDDILFDDEPLPDL